MCLCAIIQCVAFCTSYTCYLSMTPSMRFFRPNCILPIFDHSTPLRMAPAKDVWAFLDSLEQLHCFVCLNPFSEARGRIPVATNDCSHIFGLFCIEEWARSNNATYNLYQMCRGVMLNRGEDLDPDLSKFSYSSDASDASEMKRRTVQSPRMGQWIAIDLSTRTTVTMNRIF